MKTKEEVIISKIGEIIDNAIDNPNLTTPDEELCYILLNSLKLVLQEDYNYVDGEQNV